MKKHFISFFLIVSLGLFAGACLKEERRPSHHSHWNPKTRAEKHCYKEGFKPGTEEFQICCKKYEENIDWKKAQQEERREERQMRDKERQEKMMENKARQERQMEKQIENKARQEKQMERKVRQEKRMEEKMKQNKIMKKKFYYKKKTK